MSAETVPQAVPTKAILTASSGGGPMGLGDPDDRSLRKVEKDIMVAKIVRERTRMEKCKELVAAFSQCGKAAGLSIVFKCRAENTAMKNCYEQWYKDPDFTEECTQQYLQERADFRRTGITKKQKQRLAAAGNATGASNSSQLNSSPVNPSISPTIKS